jgi:flagellar hook protein FlgE
VLRDATSAQQLFTRQGNFSVDATGHLVSAAGQYVEGVNANGVTGDIVLPTGLAAQQSPLATTNFSLNVNLSSNAALNSTFSSPVQVFDSQGNPHTLTVNYVQAGTNAWNYTVTVPAADIAAGASTTVATGALTFDANGNLATPLATAGPVVIAIPPLTSTGAGMTVNWNLYPGGGATIAQNTTTSANLSTTQNGYEAGQLSGTSIGADGEIVAKFSNGQTQNVAQIELASVSNPSSMKQFDGNSFVPSGSTAPPSYGPPATGARGSVTGGALESSTVDIATEFTNLLTYERGYQANSKVITTEDQIVQQTIGLIQG